MNPRLTRQELLRRGAAGSALLAFPSLLAACGGGGGGGDGGGEVNDVLNFSNWPYYIDTPASLKAAGVDAPTTLKQFTTETGKIIRVNKDKFEEVKLPLDAAREVIRVARISGQAQLCEMGEAQTANYETLMEREAARGKWTDQQLVFINKLHLFTVMTMTGQVKATDPDTPVGTVPKEEPPKSTVTCTDADRKRIEEQILAYVKSAPEGPAKDAPAKDAPAKSAPAKGAPAKK